MQDRLDNSDVLEIKVYYSLYMLFPEQIAAIRKIKQLEEYKHSTTINLLFIPVFTSMLESLFADLFDQYLDKHRRESGDDLKNNLIDSLSSNLQKATWRNYKDAFITVFGKQINDFVPTESMQAVEALFVLRNQVIHGKQISHTIKSAGDEVERIYLDGHYKTVNEFFLSKKLMNKDELASLIFLSNKIVDYFLSHIKEFCSALATKIMEPNELLMYQIIKSGFLDKFSTISIEIAEINKEL